MTPSCKDTSTLAKLLPVFHQLPAVVQLSKITSVDGAQAFLLSCHAELHRTALDDTMLKAPTPVYTSASTVATNIVAAPLLAAARVLPMQTRSQMVCVGNRN